jgi:hypothetical protein
MADAFPRTADALRAQLLHPGLESLVLGFLTTGETWVCYDDVAQFYHDGVGEACSEYGAERRGHRLSLNDQLVVVSMGGWPRLVMDLLVAGADYSCHALLFAISRDHLMVTAFLADLAPAEDLRTTQLVLERETPVIVGTATYRYLAGLVEDLPPDTVADVSVTLP